MSAWDVASWTKWLYTCAPRPSSPSLCTRTLMDDCPELSCFWELGGVWSESTTPGQTEGAGGAVLFSPCDERREQS